MRILLVRPSPELRASRTLERSFIHLEPLALEIVAGAVPAEDEVRILDLSLEKRPDETFDERLRAWRPDMVGFTAFSAHARQVKRLAARVKAVSPETIVIVGGVHATVVPADLAVPQIDLIVRGEGATALAEILRRKKAGEPLAFEGHALDPRSESFAARCAEPPPPHGPFEELPRPRRDLVDRSRYFSAWTGSHDGKVETIFPRVATVRTSVGCAFRCSFCVVHYMMAGRYVQRAPEDVVDEIASLEESAVYFVDDEMFLNVARTKRIAELLIERGVRKSYYSWARADTIVREPELFALWKKAGLGTVYVGLESMQDSQLDAYGKRTGSNVNADAVRVLQEIGLTLHACFIVKPDFTVADFRALERDIERISPAEITFTVLSPSPGTQFWHDTKDQFICDPFHFYDCMHALVPTTLPRKLFYAHFSRLYALALRTNPLRVKKVKVPFHEVARAIFRGTQYIFALKAIHKDYDAAEHRDPDPRGNAWRPAEAGADRELAVPHV